MELIAFIRKEFNLTIFLIEHDMNLVMGICERIYVLDHGNLLQKEHQTKFVIILR